MKIASVNMTTGSSTCPPGLRTLQDPQPLCAINTDGPGCSSTVFPVQGIQYSRVCGKIIGYQQKSPDGFHPYTEGSLTIDSTYVDGISLTHGSPRKHIWTFVSALHEHNSAWPDVCPCTNTRNIQHAPIPSFVGQDVTQAVKIMSSLSSMEMILSGTGKDVVSSTPVARGTLLLGS